MEFFTAKGPYAGELVRKRKVIDIVDCTSAPPTEVLDDRYILDTTGTVNAGWDGASQNDIVQFNGTVWVSESPNEGWVTYVDDLNKDARFIDDGTPQWELIPVAGGLSIVTGSGTINLSASTYERNIKVFIDSDVSSTITPPVVSAFDTLEIIKAVAGATGQINFIGTVNGVVDPYWNLEYGGMRICSNGTNMFSPIEITP